MQSNVIISWNVCLGMNAGVLLLNLTRMRNTDFRQQVMKYQRVYRDDILLADQDLLNIYFYHFPGSVLLLILSLALCVIDSIFISWISLFLFYSPFWGHFTGVQCRSCSPTTWVVYRTIYILQITLRAFQLAKSVEMVYWLKILMLENWTFTRMPLRLTSPF